VAVLYRSNAQSRVLEEQLLTQRIPYRVYGGLRFFERAEIKDALAYLRLAAAPDDDVAFERAIANPPRGVGERTLAALRVRAADSGTSLYRAALSASGEGRMAARARNAVAGFLQLLEELTREARELSLEALAENVLQRSQLLEHHRRDRSGRGEDRVENLRELVSACRGFEPDPELAEELGSLQAFLATAALEAGEAQSGPSSDCVQLMTLHAAKGLEFPLVFLTGLEEGLFPTSRAQDDPTQLEEERRLCYVGITRAQRALVLSYAESRRVYGRENYCEPSRFLRELPPHLLREVRPRAHVSRPRFASPEPAYGDNLPVTDLPRPGASVRHPRFGEGVVLQYEGAGTHARIQVRFQAAGSKWLVLAYAKLEPA
jgi:DNA helicase-2/ATP-dependent DNA helicase PcrA